MGNGPIPLPGDLQNFGGAPGLAVTGPRGPTGMLPGVRPLRPSAPGDGGFPGSQHSMMNDFVRQQQQQQQAGMGVGLSYPAQSPLNANNGPYQNGFGGMSGYGTPQHQTNFDNLVQTKVSFCRGIMY